MESYDYSIQITAHEGQEEWIHETIGHAFHVEYNSISVFDACGRITRLEEAGFDIDYIHRRVHTAFRDVT